MAKLAKYNIGDKVCLLKSKETGTIEDIRTVNVATSYKVHIHATRNPWVTENQLGEVGQSRDPLELLRGNVFAELAKFRTYLTWMKLGHPLTDVVYAFLSSRTDFLPHQFVPVLKLLESPDQRLLIADEVGLGKTIEAGIVLAELRSRRDVRRVLVVCQGYSLQKKWQEELRDRFDEEFIIATGVDFERFLDDFENDKDPAIKAICSLPLLRSQKYVTRITELQVPFDIVIVDEAHRLRNPNSESHGMAQVLAYNTDVMLFLTATPLQMGSRDLFTLLSLLLPSEFSDFQYFDELIEPNEYLNRALAVARTKPFEPKKCGEELVHIERTRRGARVIESPYYKDVHAALESTQVWDRKKLVWLETSLQKLNVMSHVFTRTRRRDVDVNFPERVAAVINVNLSPQEATFIDRVEQFAIRSINRSTYAIAASFALMNLQRQAASSIPAMRQYLADILRRASFETEEESTDIDSDLVPGGVATSYNASGQDLEDIRLLHTFVSEVDIDTKFDDFLQQLKHQSSQGAAKFLVFSFFKRTLLYLKKRLVQENLQVGLLTGDIEYEDRITVMEEFRDTNRPYVLLSSEVGGEGLDFQFCHVLFNYDLPWNPMVVEQRIGRIDRYGQRSEKVFIFNFKIPGTIEERIFMRLYDRIGIFERAIGNIETILGNDLRDLTQEVLQGKLTPKEQEVRAEVVAQIYIKREEAMEDLERNAARLLGQDGLFMVRLNEIHNERRFVTADELRTFVHDFLAMFTKTTLLPAGGNLEDVWTLRNAEDLVTAFQAMVPSGPEVERIHHFARRAAHRLELTFSSRTANERRSLQFMTPRHPLIKGMVKCLEEIMKAPLMDPTESALKAEAVLLNPGILPSTNAIIYTDDLPPQEFVVFNYLVTTQSALKDLSLVPIAVSVETESVVPDVGRELLRLLYEADAVTSDDSEPLLNVDNLEVAAFEAITAYVQEKHDDISRNNDALLDLRLQSRERTRDVQLAAVEKMITKVREERILKMKHSQKRNIEERFKLEKQRIDIDRLVSVEHELQATCRITVAPVVSRTKHKKPSPKSEGRLVNLPPVSKISEPDWLAPLREALTLGQTAEETMHWLASRLAGDKRLVPQELRRFRELDANELSQQLGRPKDALFRRKAFDAFDCAIVPLDVPTAKNWLLALRAGMLHKDEVAALVNAIAHRAIGHLHEGDPYGYWFCLLDVTNPRARWDLEVADILRTRERN